MNPFDLVWQLVSGGYWLIAIFVLIACVAIINSVERLWNRTMRTLRVSLRGWPPAHLDADGDWKPNKNPDKIEIKE